jgi:hypothetical protein
MLRLEFCCRDGKKAGLSEGRELGLQKGWEIGQEVGFYAGCVQVCNLQATLRVGPAVLQPQSHATCRLLQVMQPTTMTLDAYTEACAAHCLQG